MSSYFETAFSSVRAWSIWSYASKAKEIIITGDMYPLADLAHTGIANRIVDPSELHATALDLANQLGSYTPQVMAAQKGLFET